ncbi:hypothetical protein C7S16_0595 [Burkholderia thailandensis]|uniref:Uncharacterized protein n=1 Tax=Burkholderia thailandensis TaxID=57975 RepID=A0AAW9CZS8_BURTH|nr:hypothetical protein [Burkholderia thailandensis]
MARAARRRASRAPGTVRPDRTEPPRLRAADARVRRRQT